MTVTSFDRYCQKFPGAKMVVQWGEAHVWKVGGKVFAVGGWSKGTSLAVTFKVDRPTFDRLADLPGCRPAPYLASRGMTWIQWTSTETLSASDLKELISDSYQLVFEKLTRKQQAEINAAEQVTTQI